MGPELKVGEDCFDRPLTSFIAAAFVEPLGALRPPATHDKGHAVTDVRSHAVGVITAVTDQVE